MTARAVAAPALDSLLAEQHGVVTRSQLLRLGLSNATAARLATAWVDVLPGVYAATTPGAPLTFEQKAHAGLLHVGADGRLRGRAAGWLQGLVDEEPAVVEVSGPWARRPRRSHPLVRTVRERPGVRLPSRPATLPVTRVEDTIIDLVAEGGEHECLTWLSRGCQRRLTTPDRLLERVRGRSRVRHRQLVKDVLLDVATGVHSHLEARWVEEVERPHGLPRLARQWVVPETGHRADGAHVATRTLLELDGRQFHAGEAGFRDNALDGRHAAAGYATFRTDWAGCVLHPCRTAALWSEVLVARGAQTRTHPCPRCRPHD